MEEGPNSRTPVRCVLHEEQLTNLLRGFQQHDDRLRQLQEQGLQDEEGRKAVIREAVTGRNAAVKAGASAERAADAALRGLQVIETVRDSIQAEVMKNTAQVVLLTAEVRDLSRRVLSLEGEDLLEEIDPPRAPLPSIVEHEHWSDQTKPDLRRMDAGWLLQKADEERAARIRAEGEAEQERLGRVKAETALSERERHSSRVHMADEMVFKKRKLEAAVLIAIVPVLLTLIAAVAKVVEIVGNLFR